jgi:hypothetical protein
MLGKHSVVAYRQEQTVITVAGGGETPSWMVLLLVDQPFSSSFQYGRKPHGWNTTRQVRSRGFSFLVPSSHPHSVCMMVRILLNSIVDNTSTRTGKKKRTTSNLLVSSHCPRSKTGSMANGGPLA